MENKITVEYSQTQKYHCKLLLVLQHSIIQKTMKGINNGITKKLVKI